MCLTRQPSARGSFSDVVQQGPKLKRALFSVLILFHKQAMALVCGIAEMYLRISDITISGNIIFNYLSTYMDNSMDSVSDDKTAMNFYKKKLLTLWKKAGMHARKWLSNLEQLLWEIPAAKSGPR